mgnify:CR=1 FL=1
MENQIDLKEIVPGEGIYCYDGSYFKLCKIKPALGYPPVICIETD